MDGVFCIINIQMIRKYIFGIAVVLFFLIVPPTIYLLDYSQSATLDSNDEVIYTLPYPGILPDHPLYFIKVVRDKLLQLKTRDNLKKAKLYLLLSDKRAAMAEALAKKGKDSLAITTFSKGEKYFLKIPDLVKNSKKQGTSPESDFVNNLKLSNAKHREIAKSFLNELPQGQNEEINQLLELNSQIFKSLQSF